MVYFQQKLSGKSGCYENSDLENIDLRPLGVSKTQTPEKFRPPGCLENTDPQFRPSNLIAYTTEMNKQVSCFQISIGSLRDDITERFRLTMTLPLPWGKDCAFYNRREFFCLLDEVRLKMPDNVYSRWPRKHLCHGNHLIVLKNIRIKNKKERIKERKKERKKENKEVLLDNVRVCVCGYVIV